MIYELASKQFDELNGPGYIAPAELPEATHLGKIVSAPVQYDASVLVAIPRSQNRDQYGIKSTDFDGNDLWRCYEFSTLTKYGMPLYTVLVIQYSSDSENIVESKSLKLYLNSFNMTKQEDADPRVVWNKVMRTIRKDLETLLKTKVAVSVGLLPEIESENLRKPTRLDNIVDYSLIVSEGYNVDAGILKESYLNEHKDVNYRFEGFRSNCKITNQPDYATVFIKYYNSSKGIDPVSLVKYLTSFRNENHFHEECCELIYRDLYSRYKPSRLSVTCCYTRRGGIDISPVRYIKPPQNLSYGATTNYNQNLSSSHDFVYFENNPERTIYQ